MIVENRGGAAGNIGAEAAAKASPEGYTLLVIANAPLVVNPALYDKLPFDPVRDFSPVTIVYWSLQMPIVPVSLPVNSV